MTINSKIHSMLKEMQNHILKKLFQRNLTLKVFLLYKGFSQRKDGNKKKIQNNTLLVFYKNYFFFAFQMCDNDNKLFKIWF